MTGYLLAITTAITAGVISVSAVASSPAQASSQDGKKHFIRCAACHSMSATDRAMTGPHLQGIVGRQVASLSDFDYSDALRSQDFIWDEDKLDAFLERPRELHPGMCLTFMGMPNADARAALIAYLKDPGE